MSSADQFVCQQLKTSDDHAANASHASTSLFVFVARLVLFVITLLYVHSHWNFEINACKADDETCMENQRNQGVSSIAQLTSRVLFVLLIVVQLCYIVHIRLTPIVATLGVVLAAVGFALQGPIQDYISGLTYAYGKNLERYDRVILLVYGQTSSKMQGPFEVVALHPTLLEVKDDDGNTRYIRYNLIHEITKVSIFENSQ